MCGIAGYMGGRLEQARHDVRHMVAALSHRGPDASQVMAFGPAVLGHARLRILDLTPAADQPLAGEDEAVWVVFNGEIYNHQELRRDLEGRGHRFASRTDTEVLVHLYEEEGPELVHRLEGMFAFAVWDTRKQRLLLARDRLGIKPLYYRRPAPGELAFASEARVLASGASLDVRSLRRYLRLGWVPGPATIWEGVAELPAGCRLVWENGEPAVGRYWSPLTVPGAAADHERDRDRLAGALDEAMRRHLVADVPVALFLSSGVDSSVLASLLARHSADVRTFTVAFEGLPGEETEAAQIAARLGLSHTVVPISGREIVHSVPGAVAALDQPSVDGINSWVISRAVRGEGIVVALSGLGGDELFRGYSTFQHVPRLVRAGLAAGHLPGPVRRTPAAVAARLPRWAATRQARALEALGGGGSWAEAYAAVRGALPDDQVSRLMGTDGGGDDGLVHLAGEAGPGDAVRLLELGNYLPFQLLRDADAMSMAHSLEVRVPLLDDAVVAAGNGFSKKDLVYAADPGLLDLAARPKQTFTLPFDAWLRGPLRADAGAALHGLAELGIEPRALRAVWDGFHAGRVPGGGGGGGRGGPAGPPPHRGRPPPRPLAPSIRTAPRAAADVVLVGDQWPADEAGGLNRYLADLGDTLIERGGKARAVVLGPAAGAPHWVHPAGSPDEPIPLRLAKIAREAARCAGYGATLDVHFPLNGLLPALSLRKLPLVFHFQGPWVAESVIAGHRSPVDLAVRRAIERAVHRRVRRFVVLSHAFKQLLIRDYGIAPWRISVIPPGVDLDRFSPADRADARRRLGLRAGERIVLAVRRLDPRMGLDVLIEAWAKAGGGRNRSTLVIVGRGPDATRLKEHAAAHGVEQSVRFTGAVTDEDLVDWYRAADVTVVPSLALEGFGLVVLESLACGTPVVVSDAGALPEAVRGLGGDLVVPAGDAGAWAHRLSALIDGDRALPHPADCRTYAERFSWDGIAAAHERLYAEARHPTDTTQRVVYIDHCAEISGAELSLLDLVAIKDQDAHVILGADGPLVPLLHQLGATTEVRPLGDRARTLPKGSVQAGRLPAAALLQSVTYTVALARRLRQLRPDVVHTNTTKAALYGGVAARLAGVPLLWHIRDQIVPGQFPPLARRLIRALARVLPDGIAANSASTLALLGSPGRPSAVVPSVVLDAQEWDVDRTDRGPDRPLRIGTIGRIASIKGQDLFLKAFSRSCPEGAEAVIVGQALFNDLPFEQELVDLVKTLGIEGRVDFRGHRGDVREELGRLDVFVHSSVVPEGFGRAIVEAMATGLPVIATDAGGPAEIITDGENGLLVPLGDVDALAEAIARLANSPDLRDRLGAAARATASRFSVERLADSALDLTGAAMARRRNAR